jgi:serine/threonine protein kinase
VNAASFPKLLDGKYEIIRQLGRGGMGTVYEGRHRATGRRVALKVIAADRLASTASAVHRFQREALASGAIDSQYVAQILDAATDAASGQSYLVLELLFGEDLHQALRRMGALPADLALRIAAQACLGLRKAHEAQITHRDIKPANIFLARRDHGVTVKLLDFGLAKLHERSRAEDAVAPAGAVTVSGVILGSPSYMSPEQALGQKTLDHRTDLWSLGVVLYEMLSGRTPVGDAEAAGEVILRICTQPPPPLRDVAPAVAPEVAAIVHKALAREPAERFATAREMFEAIEPLLPGGVALEETMFPPLPGAAGDVAVGVPVGSGFHDESTLTPEEARALERSNAPRGGEHDPARATTSRPRSLGWSLAAAAAVIATGAGVAMWRSSGVDRAAGSAGAPSASPERPTQASGAGPGPLASSGDRGALSADAPSASPSSAPLVTNTPSPARPARPPPPRASAVKPAASARTSASLPSAPGPSATTPDPPVVREFK